MQHMNKPDDERIQFLSAEVERLCLELADKVIFDRFIPLLFLVIDSHSNLIFKIYRIKCSRM